MEEIGQARLTDLQPLVIKYFGQFPKTLHPSRYLENEITGPIHLTLPLGVSLIHACNLNTKEIICIHPKNSVSVFHMKTTPSVVTWRFVKFMVPEAMTGSPLGLVLLT